MSSESSRSTSHPRLLARSTNISEQSLRPYRPSVTVPNAGPVNRVIVTPLNLVRSTVDLSSASCCVAESQCIGKVLIKVFAKGSKKESKMFTLRNIDTAIKLYTSLSILEGVIREQLGDEICQGSFDMGYLRGSNTVTLRNKEDIIEVWANIKNRKNMMWCDGLNRKTENATQEKIILQSSEEEDDDLEDKFRRRKRSSSRKKDQKRSKIEEKDENVLLLSVKNMVILIHQCNIEFGQKCILVGYIQVLILLPLLLCSVEQVVLAQQKRNPEILTLLMLYLQ